MRSILPIAQTLVTKGRATRWIAARIASALVPQGNLAPLTHEALCYGCMVGILLPTHLASREKAPDDRDTKLTDDPAATPDINTFKGPCVTLLS